MMKPPLLLAAALVLLFSNRVFGQKDTEFWFVAPEIAHGTGPDYDTPVMFRFSTYDAPAIITVAQPANANFAIQTISLATNSSGLIQFFNIDDFENKPPNTILNYGFLITSTAPVSAYYEIIGGCACNPVIFSMKGKNALGMDFFVPFQTYLDNSSVHFPLPHAAFDIVATENNTTVTVKPTQAIVGHTANTQFSITLQSGQIWSGEAVGQGAFQHPSGTRVTSNKPIAITIKDDLLDGSVFGGFCRDGMGDQIVPVNKTGTKYAIQKGFLTGTEKAFVVGTASGTMIKINGTTAGTVNEGQTFTVDISNGQYFIETSKPVYVLQLTGIGCEVAGEIMPSLDCNGSSSVRFVRPTNEPFWLYLVTQNGNQSGFTLNGNSGLIVASNFSVLPGSGGQYVAAVIPFSASQIADQLSSIVKNNLGDFQMGLLNGQELATGARFGFFSDFGKQINRDTSLAICEGETLLFNGISITQAGVYYDTLPGTTGCDTLLTIEVEEEQFVAAFQEISFCEGDTVRIQDIVMTEAGTFTDTLSGGIGCDTILTIIATTLTIVQKTEAVKLCRGESIVIDGITYTQSTTVIETLPGIFYCDTVITYVIDISDIAVFLDDTIHILLGLSTHLNPSITSSKDVQVSWSPPTNLDNPGLQNPKASPEETTKYTLVTTDEFGCTASDSVVVAVREIDCAQGIYIPNVFSPNDDGINDFFTVFTNQECIVKVRVLRVYNRWGELVFEKFDFSPNDFSRGWDGTVRKKQANPGVYVYYAELETYLGTIEKKSGDVTLLK